MQTLLSDKSLFYPRRQEASLPNILQEFILMEDTREKLKAQVVCFKHWMFPLPWLFWPLVKLPFMLHIETISSFLWQGRSKL